MAVPQKTLDNTAVHRVGLRTRNKSNESNVCGKITSKQMVACFLGKSGHVATVPLEHRRTVSSEWYNRICLPKVFGEIWKTNKRRGNIVHLDNASHHTSASTPNDFFVFIHIKQKTRRQRFSSPENAVESFENHILEVSQSEWKSKHKWWSYIKTFWVPLS